MFQTLCVTLNRTVKFVTFNICLINHSSTSSNRHQKKMPLKKIKNIFFPILQSWNRIKCFQLDFNICHINYPTHSFKLVMETINNFRMYEMNKFCTLLAR